MKDRERENDKQRIVKKRKMTAREKQRWKERHFFCYFLLSEKALFSSIFEAIDKLIKRGMKNK